MQIPKTALRLAIAVLSFAFAQVSLAQDFVWAPDFPVGESIPAINAPDQNGDMKSFDDLVGEKGLVLMLSRSFDWWPFCKAQLVQLTEIQQQFQAMGFGIATITYDPVELLMEVKEDQEIEFTLLHDEAVTHINAFGIRNLDYEPGARAYGIPYPGIFLIDTEGVIRFKFAEESYRVRPDFTDILEAAAKL